MTTITRRQFLKGGTCLAGAVAIAPFIPMENLMGLYVPKPIKIYKGVEVQRLTANAISGDSLLTGSEEAIRSFVKYLYNGELYISTTDISKDGCTFEVCEIPKGSKIVDAGIGYVS